MPLGYARGPNSFMGPRSITRAPVEVVASTTTIAVHSQFVRLTGSTAVATITPPDPYFVGPLYLFNTDSSVNTTVTTGNIALASTLTRYKVFTFLYDVGTSKWYPSATS